MTSFGTTLENFFGVFLRGQSYRSMLYLLLAFPLGIFYFVFLVTGISLGVGMIILWIGLLILVGVLAAWYGMAAFERWLAIALLGEDIPAMTREDLSSKTIWQKFVVTLKNPVTWKSFVYLMARFPLGILSFVVLITLGSVSLALIGAPFYYQYVPTGMDITLNGIYYLPVMVDTLSEAILVSLVGLLLALVSLHAFNGLAWLSGKFARIMLGNFSSSPVKVEPASPTAEPAAAPSVLPAAIDEPASTTPAADAPLPGAQAPDQPVPPAE